MTSERSPYGSCQRRLRQISGYTLKRLATLTDLSENTLARYEIANVDQRRNPSPESLALILEAFKQSPACSRWLTLALLEAAEVDVIERQIEREIKGAVCASCEPS